MDQPTLSHEPDRIDDLCINTIRCLSLDAIQKANSGHPGLPLGAAPMAYLLWTRFLKHHPSDPNWIDRDRFILSGGHGSMLLYSLLHLTGYDLSLDQIKQFRQWRSLTPGHPEKGLVPGAEVTTGPLGQGFANGVGTAMAERFLASRYNRPGFEIINHFTYGIVSDGDLMEGVAQEAASLAGHLKLGKLIYLYDNNYITLAGATDLVFTEDRAKRFEAYGWQVLPVADGNDLNAIAAAIREARLESAKPSLILVRTHIGYGSPHKQDTFEAHGAPLGEEEVKLTKQRLGWSPEASFHIPDPVRDHFRKWMGAGQSALAGWNRLFSSYGQAFPGPAQELQQIFSGGLPGDWSAEIPSFPSDPKGMATRVASGKVLNAIAPKLPTLIGGSADLNPSTNTAMKGLGDFQSPDWKAGDPQGAVGGPWGYEGRNIHFGVREHAMGAILNGMAVHGGIIPFGATFMVFSDYLRPSIRLAALMEQRVIYVFTHDSVGVGEDGPTHQPVEHVAALRTIPNLRVLRPCDANETAVAWKVAIETPNRPTVLALTRQNVPTLDRSQVAPAEGLRKGAYVLLDPLDHNPEVILMASGSEVSLILEVQKRLAAQKIPARVVSFPCWELFEEQPGEYRSSVLPSSVKIRVAAEAGISQGWHRYVGDHGEVIAIDRFGASAPGPVVMREYGMTVDHILERVLALTKANPK